MRLYSANDRDVLKAERLPSYSGEPLYRTQPNTFRSDALLTVRLLAYVSIVVVPVVATRRWVAELQLAWTLLLSMTALLVSLLVALVKWLDPKMLYNGFIFPALVVSLLLCLGLALHAFNLLPFLFPEDQIFYIMAVAIFTLLFAYPLFSWLIGSTSSSTWFGMMLWAGAFAGISVLALLTRSVSPGWTAYLFLFIPAEVTTIAYANIIADGVVHYWCATPKQTLATRREHQAIWEDILVGRTVPALPEGATYLRDQGRLFAGLVAGAIVLTLLPRGSSSSLVSFTTFVGMLLGWRCVQDALLKTEDVVSACWPAVRTSWTALVIWTTYNMHGSRARGLLQFGGWWALPVTRLAATAGVLALNAVAVQILLATPNEPLPPQHPPVSAPRVLPAPRTASRLQLTEDEEVFAHQLSTMERAEYRKALLEARREAGHAEGMVPTFPNLAELEAAPKPPPPEPSDWALVDLAKILLAFVAPFGLLFLTLWFLAGRVLVAVHQRLEETEPAEDEDPKPEPVPVTANA